MGISEDRDNYEFEKLAHDMTLARVTKEEPQYKSRETSAEILRELVFLAITHTRVKQDPRLTLKGIFRGIMQAMFALDKDLPETSVRLLQEIPNLSDRLVIEFSDLMTWAMEGIASLSGPLGRENCRKIRTKIDENFMGAGGVFDKLCAESHSQ